MTEREKPGGSGSYYRKIFLICQKISANLSYDAWHQFAVINPMKFLGLIDEGKESKEEYEIDVGKIKKFTDRLPPYRDNEKWVQKSNQTSARNDIQKQCNEIISKLTSVKIIKDPTKILKNDEKLLILA
jgi:hypothetical protein